jgi:hypothetical protein
MDEYIKQSIEGRKNAIGATYEVSTGMQKKIDALFGEIEELGGKCKDVGDFEVKFAASPLNQKYLDLFTEVATNSQAKATAPKVDKSGIAKMVATGTAVGVAESALEQAIDNVVPTRAAVNQELTDTVRGAPVLGDIMDVSEKAGYAAHLGKLFGKKKKKN